MENTFNLCKNCIRDRKDEYVKKRNDLLLEYRCEEKV